MEVDAQIADLVSKVIKVNVDLMASQALWVSEEFGIDSILVNRILKECHCNFNQAHLEFLAKEDIPERLVVMDCQD